MMMKRRNVFTVFTSLLIGIALIQFQNCAPTKAPGPTAANTGEVRIIDEWSSTELQFVAQKVEVRDQASETDIGGLCHRARNGAFLEFAVFQGESPDRPLVTGQSVCERGQFALKLADLEIIPCGQNHLLVVEGDWGGTAATYLYRRCQPAASESVEAPASSPAGTSCALEFNPSLGESGTCTQVCYRGDLVVHEQPVEEFQCSALAAKVASGP